MGVGAGDGATAMGWTFAASATTRALLRLLHAGGAPQTAVPVAASAAAPAAA